MLDTTPPCPAPLRRVLESNNSSTTTVAVEAGSEKVDSAAKGTALESAAHLEKAAAASLDDGGEESFPEGGWDAWACTFGAWWMVFFSFGSVNAFGVFQQYYATQLLPHKAMSDIAWIGSFQFFFVFGSGAIAGRAFDLGYLRPLLAASIAMLVL